MFSKLKEEMRDIGGFFLPSSLVNLDKPTYGSGEFIEQLSENYGTNEPPHRNKINIRLLISNTFQFLVESFSVILFSLLDLWVNFMKYNVQLLFSLRSLVLKGTELIIICNLYIIEMFIFIEILTINMVYIVKRTRTDPKKTNDIFDSNGFLKFSMIHDFFWDGRNLSFSNELDSEVSISTELMDFQGGNSEIASEDIEKDIAMNLSYSKEGSEDTISTKDDNMSEVECQDVESDHTINKGKYHFGFGHRRSKKKEKEPYEMDAFEMYITDKLNEIPIPGSRILIKSNIFK